MGRWGGSWGVEGGGHKIKYILWKKLNEFFYI